MIVDITDIINFLDAFALIAVIGIVYLTVHILWFAVPFAILCAIIAAAVLIVRKLW